MIKGVVRLALIGFVCIAWNSLSWSGDLRFSKTILDNGMTLIVNEMPSSPMAAIYAWVKTGSANEGKYIGSGITHFVEHMLFKGTAIRKAGDISEEVRAMGGTINAATSYDFTVFTLSVPRENLKKGLELIADMLRNAVFDSVEVEREREVIEKEMKMVNDRPDRKLDEIVYRSAYLVHSYRYPVIGHQSVFHAISRDQLMDYYKTYYAPNNMILSVAGGVDESEVLLETKKVFDGFFQRSVPLRILPQEPLQVTPRFEEIRYPTDLIRLNISYQGMPLFDKDLFAGDVLAMALGSGESSRLNQQLHEKKRIVEAIDAVNDTPMDRGRFEVSCLLSKDNVDEVLAGVQGIAEDIKIHGLKEEELEKIKRIVMAQNIYSRQMAEAVANRAAMEEAFTGDARFSDKYLQGVRLVTNDDIRRIAQKYLSLSSRTVVVMRPETEVQPVDLKSGISPEPDEPQLFILPNGVKVILKKDASLPLVSVQAVFKGGLREEPEEKPGLAELTGRVWSRCVKGKTAGQLVTELESRAGSLSAGAGLDLFSASISVLSEDFSLAMDDLGLLLLSPTFPENEINKQKANMLTAMQLRKDSIVQTSFRALYETLFTGHPLRRDPLGTSESLARITRDDIVSFYNRYASSGNLIVAVYGDIDIEKTREGLARRLGAMKSFDRQISFVQEPVLTSKRQKELSMDKEQALVVYGFHAPKVGTTDKYALEVAVNALSSSLGGRMFKRIRDELGKAYALNGMYSPGLDMGVCFFYVLTTKENADKVGVLIEEELMKAAINGFSDKELSDAKEYLKADFARDSQSIGAQAVRDTASEFYGLGVKAYQLYGQRIDAVTADSARDVTAQYLDVSRAAVIITRPVQ